MIQRRQGIYTFFSVQSETLNNTKGEEECLSLAEVLNS